MNRSERRVPKYYDYEYYVGDPCYVIDDNRWDEFCKALWTQQEESEKAGRGKYNYPFYIDWVVDDNTFTVEVWNSPFGDGTWNFSNTVKEMRGWIAGVEMGVDAGLLAIVPYGAISNNRTCIDKDDVKEISNLGIIFTHEPYLETGEHVKGHVRLNDNDEDNVMYCWECGDEIQEHDEISCDNGNCIGCYSCYECKCEEEE